MSSFFLLCFALSSSCASRRIGNRGTGCPLIWRSVTALPARLLRSLLRLAAQFCTRLARDSCARTGSGTARSVWSSHARGSPTGLRWLVTLLWRSPSFPLLSSLFLSPPPGCRCVAYMRGRLGHGGPAHNVFVLPSPALFLLVVSLLRGGGTAVREATTGESGLLRGVVG